MNLQEAVQRCWVEVDLAALGDNYLNACKRASGALVIPVIKADGYGMGGIEVARKLASLGARMAAVATAQEALDIKSRGIMDALVLGMTPEACIGECIESGVVLTAYSLSSARQISREAAKLGHKARVHLKVNTGLNRLGFDDFEEFREALSLTKLNIEGVYTHLALHDAAHDAQQFALFDRFAQESNAPMRHVLDSIGLFEYPDRLYDAVRIGAYLYGVDPKSDEDATSKRVASFFARVVQTRIVKKGGLVGYDDDHTLERDTVVATISAGYVDGYPRKSDLSCVEIRGRRAKVLGLVCMDQMMVDATDIPDVTPGDKVTLLGGGISLEEYSSWWGLNRNEAISRIGPRAARVYTDKSGVIFTKEQ